VTTEQSSIPNVEGYVPNKAACTHSVTHTDTILYRSYRAHRDRKRDRVTDTEHDRAHK
jgi:hypothetical protein